MIQQTLPKPPDICMRAQSGLAPTQSESRYTTNYAGLFFYCLAVDCGPDGPFLVVPGAGRAGALAVCWQPEPEMRPNEHVVVVLLPFFGRPGHRHQFTFSSSDSLLYIFRVLVERTGVASGQGGKNKNLF